MALASSARIVRHRPPVKAAERFVKARRFVQIFSVVAFIGMPILGIFRADFDQGYMVLFWQHVSLDWLVPALIVLIMVPIVAFTLLAVRSGRLFCSWWCAHGAMNEAATKGQLALWGRRKLWVSRSDPASPEDTRRLSKRWLARGSAWWWTLARYVAGGTVLPLLAAFAIVSYVASPSRLADLLFSWQWGDALVILFLFLSVFLIANYFLFQEGACRLCMFGALQSMVSYPRGAGARRNPEFKSACHGCSGCRDACFAGLDPRVRGWDGSHEPDLAFDQCVSCGDCVVACDDLTSRRGVPLVMELPPRVLSQGGLSAKK